MRSANIGFNDWISIDRLQVRIDQKARLSNRHLYVTDVYVNSYFDNNTNHIITMTIYVISQCVYHDDYFALNIGLRTMV